MILNLTGYCPPPPPPPSALILYDAGDEKSAASGGWSAFAPAWDGYTYVYPNGSSSWTGHSNPVGCEKRASNLEIAFRNLASSDCFSNGAFGTGSKIDLSGWSQLHIRATAAASAAPIAHYHVFGVTNSKATPADPGSNTPPGTYKTIAVGDTVLDVSSISASRYVYFAGMARSRGNIGTADRYVNIVVTKIWLT